MRLRIRCPACGKGIEIDERDAGLPALCLACGHRFATEPPAAPAPITAETPVAIEPPAQAPPQPRRSRAPVSVVVFAILAVVGGVTWAIVRPAGRSPVASNSSTEPRQPSPQTAPTSAPTNIVPSPAPTIPEQIPLGPKPDMKPATAPTSQETAPAAEPLRVSPPPLTQPAAAPPALIEPPRAPKRLALQPQPEPPPIVTDEAIGKAIQRGVDWLLGEFDLRAMQLKNNEGRQNDPAYFCGLNALAVYALLQSGQAINDPRLNIRGDLMPKLVERMKRLSPEPGHPEVYARGLRATALALYGRPEDRAILRADLNYLLRANRDGAYTYRIADRSPRAPMPGMLQGVWDNSNSQYGLLGVWSAAEAGEEIPSAYWFDAEKHWTDCQSANGQWAYRHGGDSGTLSMTAAGMASLFVAEEYLDRSRYGARVGRQPFSNPLERALQWFETGDNAVRVPGGWWGYTLYGIERVGLASGFKYFGQNDWYPTLARQSLDRQQINGSWGEIVDTSYQLLFLARGRHPILMNKLRFKTYWANRPRDVANLARYVGKQLERPLNWQVVPLERPWQDWLDSPILYLASHKAVALQDKDYENLRSYVEAGGLLFTHADDSAPAFDDFAEKLAQKLFPKYEMRDLPPGHAIYDILYKIDPQPKLRAVMNGSRVLMLHAPTDIARHWQLRNDSIQKSPFQLGANLFVYMAGKREFRNRIASTYVSDPGEPLAGHMNVARIQYTGNDDPEPGAWRRFARLFQRRTGIRPTVQPTPLKALNAQLAPFAHWTGTTDFTSKPNDLAALRTYVESGGVLLVDAVGGSVPFARSARNTLIEAFPTASLAALKSDALPPPPGAAGDVIDLTKPRLRPSVVERLGGGAGRLETLTFGKGRVVFTELDVTSGLLDFSPWEILGYQPDYAQQLVERLLLQAWATQAAK